MDGEGGARVKGINFRSFVTALEQLRGAPAVEATLRTIPADLAAALQRGGLVAGGWYSIAWYRALHVAMQRACGAGRDLSRQIGRESTLAEFRGVYRHLVRVLSPELLVSQAPRVFRMYFQGGETESLEARKGMGCLRFAGWSGFDANVWHDVVGGIEGVLLARGAENVRARVLAGAEDDDDGMTIEYRWT